MLGGNPDLKPEESISYEIGLDQKLTMVYLQVYLLSNQVKNLISSECVAM
jgi:vitamin B12 transporter